MYADWYEKISAPFRTTKRTRMLRTLDTVVVALFAAGYIGTIAGFAISGDARLVRALVVPSGVLLLASALRILVAAPRPYELFDIRPVLADTHTKGKSMPSRHAACATILACTFWLANPLIGILGILGCACCFFTRIVGGVHFPKDVAAGCALALACAVIGYVLI